MAINRQGDRVIWTPLATTYYDDIQVCSLHFNFAKCNDLIALFSQAEKLTSSNHTPHASNTSIVHSVEPYPHSQATKYDYYIWQQNAPYTCSYCT